MLTEEPAMVNNDLPEWINSIQEHFGDRVKKRFSVFYCQHFY